jgi:hypothetical protein
MDNYDEKNIVTQIHCSIDFIAFMQLQLISNPDMSIKSCLKRWQKSHDWNCSEDYHLVNQGSILTHLYGLILVPQQVFFDKIPHIDYSVVDKTKWGDFQINKWEKKKNANVEDKTLHNIFRHIRNSLAHNRYEVKEDLTFIFKDQDNNDTPIHTEIEFSINDLQKFVSKAKAGFIDSDWN